MIHYFIFGKKIGLKRSCILKVLDFLIFRDFSKILMNFLILF